MNEKHPRSMSEETLFRFRCHYCTGRTEHVPGCPQIEHAHDEEIKQWNDAVLKLHEEKRQLERRLAAARAALEVAEISLVNCLPTHGFNMETLPIIRKALSDTE